MGASRQARKAFQEFWDLLLKSADGELHLPARELAEEVAQRRGKLYVNRRWAWMAFSRRSVLKAVQTIKDIYMTGAEKLVLLCHCGVANATKPCHAAIIQKHIVQTCPSRSPNAPLDPPRKCVQC